MKYILSFSLSILLYSSAAQTQEYGLMASDETNSDHLETIKKATVAIVENEKIQSTEIFTFGETYKFCSQQKFENEKLWSNCSGVLISKNVVLTAGHCLQSLNCPDKSFVFDYRSNGDIPRIQIDKNQIYNCKKVLYWSKPVLQKQLKDFALIQLDRDVTDRPAIVLSKMSLSRAENIFSIGHPLGLPLKISNGYVTEKNAAQNKISKKPFYAAQMSSHPGLSGGGVYNSDQRLIGLLVRGESNLEKDNHCVYVKSCDKSSCPWAEVQKLDINLIQKYIH